MRSEYLYFNCQISCRLWQRSTTTRESCSQFRSSPLTFSIWSPSLTAGPLATTYEPLATTSRTSWWRCSPFLRHRYRFMSLNNNISNKGSTYRNITYWGAGGGGRGGKALCKGVSPMTALIIMILSLRMTFLRENFVSCLHFHTCTGEAEGRSAFAWSERAEFVGHWDWVGSSSPSQEDEETEQHCLQTNRHKRGTYLKNHFCYILILGFKIIYSLLCMPLFDEPSNFYNNCFALSLCTTERCSSIAIDQSHPCLFSLWWIF